MRTTHYKIFCQTVRTSPLCPSSSLLCLYSSFKYQIATRAQILGILAAGLPGKVVEEHTEISTATQYRWWGKAVARG